MKVPLYQFLIIISWFPNVQIFITYSFGFMIQNQIKMGVNLQKHQILKILTSFFNFCLAALQPTLGHNRGDTLTHRMLIAAFLQFQPKGHWKPHNEILLFQFTFTRYYSWTGPSMGVVCNLKKVKNGVLVAWD